jgi:hypothetical protein
MEGDNLAEGKQGVLKMTYNVPQILVECHFSIMQIKKSRR